jgi:hypothetical protein
MSETAQTDLLFPKPEKFCGVEFLCPDWCWKRRRDPGVCAFLSRRVAPDSCGTSKEMAR